MLWKLKREMKDLLEKYKMFQTPKLANEISWKDMKEFNSYMKEVVRDYKIKQAKSIQSARNVIISWPGKVKIQSGSVSIYANKSKPVPA